MPNNNVLNRVNVGDTITASLFNDITTAINSNTQAIAAPRQKDSSEELTATASVEDEVFSCTVTESTQTATDSGGDTVDIERVDTVSCVETTTGRTMTLNITY